MMFGVLSVAAPFAAILIGGVLEFIIPGCHCNEGTGCNGCSGLGGLIELFTFGGFVLALIALVTVFPFSMFAALMMSMFSKPEK